MGVRFGREYSDIVQEVAVALENIDGLNDFLNMDAEQWHSLDAKDRWEYIRTISDDVFYALGQDPTLTIGSGYAEYDAKRHVLKVYDGSKVTIVSLI
ncbi:hypothetical protein QBE55_05020 [Eubacteriales bacterium mix99]|jgi:hypothetical protein|nr:hypothetical protein [Clostridiales bacterium]